MRKSASSAAFELTRPASNSSQYVLTIKQEPEESKVAPKQEKTRSSKWPLDPPPVIELTVGTRNNENTTYLHSPFWFCNVEVDVVAQTAPCPVEKLLMGTTVSSLHRVKHNDNTEKGYFIFGDLNIKVAGTYRLKFSLFEMRLGPEGMFAEHLGNTVHTRQFSVLAAKATLAQRESTSLSKALCEAGVKLRIRKEPSRRRRSGQVDWSNRQGYAGVHHPMAHVGPGPVFAPTALSQMQRAGEDISNRLSLRNSGLADRNLMNLTNPMFRGNPMYPPNPQPTNVWEFGSGQMPPVTTAYETNPGIPTYTSSGTLVSQYIPTPAVSTSSHGTSSGLPTSVPFELSQLRTAPTCMNYHNSNSFNQVSQVGGPEYMTSSLDQQSSFQGYRVPTYQDIASIVTSAGHNGQQPSMYPTSASMEMTSSQLPSPPIENEPTKQWHTAPQNSFSGGHQRYDGGHQRFSGY